MKRRPGTQPILISAPPPDPFWLRRVIVKNDGDCVPFELWLLWHHQFFLPRGDVA